MVCTEFLVRCCWACKLQCKARKRCALNPNEEDTIIGASANKAAQSLSKITSLKRSWRLFFCDMNICLQASDGSRWMSFTCAQSIRKETEREKDTEGKKWTVFRSNAIRSKNVYFPHELLQWPMRWSTFSRLFFRTQTPKSTCRTQFQSKRRAQWLQRGFDWMCSV